MLIINIFMFNLVNDFETTIADFYGASYAVATDSCTHAIELCLLLQEIKNVVSCPRYTYISIPMTFKKINLDWKWSNEKWKDFYRIGNTNIIDAAVLWKKDSYIPGTFMCLSFQFKKHLSLGRGGMILLDDYNSYKKLIKMSYDGRDRDTPWTQQNIDTFGYHYYMTPETAALGIEKFKSVKDKEPIKWDYLDYPDLSTFDIFK